jgi:hypothetical protein
VSSLFSDLPEAKMGENARTAKNINKNAFLDN